MSKTALIVKKQHIYSYVAVEETSLTTFHCVLETAVKLSSGYMGHSVFYSHFPPLPVSLFRWSAFEFCIWGTQNLSAPLKKIF